ncbi:hypothetical protein FRX31_028424 [Thalictrum thalictroides]|uniref:Uncharacterized protein n=1 Tax=Thalictrum thalictroides TaxID=46969 RepID=A0A7J6VAA6_THATH|nr:hypothetical protein FRX31_028424 [Thalictrum thalictroides]
MDNNIVSIVEDRISKKYAIWMLREYGVKESWTKLYTIGTFEWSSSSYPCKISNNVRYVFVMKLLKTYMNELDLYNIATKETKNLHVRDNSHLVQFVEYNESLLSIKRDKSSGAPDQWRRVVEGITRGSPTQNRGNQAQVHAAEITQSNRFQALQESDMRSPAHAQCSPRPQSPIQPQIQAQVQNTTQNPNVPLDLERSSQSIYHSQATPSRSNSGPNLNLGWGHSLVLSKRLLGPTPSHSRKRKPRNGKNRNLAVQALNQLQETEHMGTHVQQVSILQRNDPLPSLNQPTLVENSTPAVSFSEASNDRFFHENCRIGLGELENSSSTSNSCPPGFGEANYNLKSADLMSQLLDDCCKVRSGSELNKWISNVVRDLASKMGVTSIHGKDAIEKFFFELGTRHLKAKRVVELNEDEQERLGYANSNDVLRELNLT